jgi:hypothetical protein
MTLWSPKEKAIVVSRTNFASLIVVVLDGGEAWAVLHGVVGNVLVWVCFHDYLGELEKITCFHSNIIW